MVSTERSDTVSQAYSGNRQPQGRLAITTPILQEPVARKAHGFPVGTSVLDSSPRCGPIRRQNNQPVYKIRLLEARPRRMANRRILPRLVTVPLAVDQPTMELTNEVHRKTSAGEALTPIHCSDTTLDERALVPLGEAAGNLRPHLTPSAGHRTAVSPDQMSLDSNQINSLRLDALSSSSLSEGLSLESMAIIRHPRLVDSTTNRSYRRGQELSTLR